MGLSFISLHLVYNPCTFIAFTPYITPASVFLPQYSTRIPLTVKGFYFHFIVALHVYCLHWEDLDVTWECGQYNHQAPSLENHKKITKMACCNTAIGVPCIFKESRALILCLYKNLRVNQLKSLRENIIQPTKLHHYSYITLSKLQHILCRPLQVIINEWSLCWTKDTMS